ncbi:MAG: hypothetical protein IPJ65_00890 [Archangiaceae bacterium]|nr:hypothetical protein [Archangiaceae bacterium]
MTAPVRRPSTRPLTFTRSTASAEAPRQTPTPVTSTTTGPVDSMEPSSAAKDLAKKVAALSPAVTQAASDSVVAVSGENNANQVYVPQAGSIEDVDAVVSELSGAELITADEKEAYDAASEEEKRAMAEDFITRAQQQLQDSLSELAPDELAAIQAQYGARTFVDGKWGNASQAALMLLVQKGQELSDAPVDSTGTGYDTETPPVVPGDDRPAGDGAVTEADTYFTVGTNGRQGMPIIAPDKLEDLQQLRARVEAGTASDEDAALWKAVQDKAASLHIAKFNEKTAPTSEQVAETFFGVGTNGRQGAPIVDPERVEALQELRARVEADTASDADVQLWEDVQAAAQSKRIAKFDETSAPTPEQVAETFFDVNDRDRAHLARADDFAGLQGRVASGVANEEEVALYDQVVALAKERGVTLPDASSAATSAPVETASAAAPRATAQDLVTSLDGVDFDDVNWNTVAQAAGATPHGSDKHLSREQLETAKASGKLTGDDARVVDALLANDALWESYPSPNDDGSAVVISLDQVEDIAKQKGGGYEAWVTRSGFTAEELAEADAQRAVLQQLCETSQGVRNDLFPRIGAGNGGSVAQTFDFEELTDALATASDPAYRDALEFFSDPAHFALIGGSDGEVSRKDLEHAFIVG